MRVLTSSGLKRNFFFFSAAWLSLIVAAAASFAGEKNLAGKDVQTSSQQASSQIIVINPETGELDPKAAATAGALTLQTDQNVPTQEQFTYHKDGSVTVDFNGKFNMPVYGHINNEGNVVLSHEQSQGGKK